MTAILVFVLAAILDGQAPEPRVFSDRVVSADGSEVELIRRSRTETTAVVVRAWQRLLVTSDVVTTVTQPTSVLGFGISDDEVVFWVVSHQVRDGTPVTHVEVFDLAGGAVAQVDVSAAGPRTFRHGAKSCTVQLPAPDYPG